MTINLGTIDRIARAVLGAVLLGLAFTAATGALQIVAAVAGLVLLGTAAMKTCPIYALLGLRTCKDC